MFKVLLNIPEIINKKLKYTKTEYENYSLEFNNKEIKLKKFNIKILFNKLGFSNNINIPASYLTMDIYDIKEKYGELRIEVNIASHYVNKVIEKYEYISYRTCGICGLPADKLSDGWIFPYCKKCADKTTVIGFEDFEDWYGYKSIKNID